VRCWINCRHESGSRSPVRQARGSAAFTMFGCDVQAIPGNRLMMVLAKSGRMLSRARLLFSPWDKLRGGAPRIPDEKRQLPSV
jgi:hypothetical protein